MNIVCLEKVLKNNKNALDLINIQMYNEFIINEIRGVS